MISFELGIAIFVICIVVLCLGLGLGLGLPKQNGPISTPISTPTIIPTLTPTLTPIANISNQMYLTSSVNKTGNNLLRQLSTDSNRIKNTRICVDWSGTKLFDYSVTIDDNISQIIGNSFGISPNCRKMLIDVRTNTTSPFLSPSYVEDCNNNILSTYILNGKTIGLQVFTKRTNLTDSKLLDISQNIMNYFNNTNYIVYIAYQNVDPNDPNGQCVIMFYILDYTKLIKGSQTSTMKGLTLLLSGTSDVLTYIDNMCNY